MNLLMIQIWYKVEDEISDKITQQVLDIVWDEIHKVYNSCIKARVREV